MGESPPGHTRRVLPFLPALGSCTPAGPLWPHHCGQGARRIPLITHVLDPPAYRVKDWTASLGFSPAGDGFLLLSMLVSFQIKNMRGHGVNHLTGCLRSQHCMGHLQQRPSAYSLQDHIPPAKCSHTWKLWSSPLRHEWEKDMQSKDPSEIHVLICISWMFLPLEKLYITVELFAAKLSIRAAIRHSLPPNLHHTVWCFSENFSRNVLVWTISFYR